MLPPADLGDTTFEAIIHGCARSLADAEADVLRPRVEALCAAGVELFVRSVMSVDELDGRLAARPPGPGHLHLGVAGGSEAFLVSAHGLRRVTAATSTEADALRWWVGWLAARGVTGGLILATGEIEANDVPLGAAHRGRGTVGFLEAADGQLRRRAEGRPPWIDEDPAWVLRLPDDPERARIVETLGALSNGWCGTRGDGHRSHAPHFFVGGIYTDGADHRLLPGPLWTGLHASPGANGSRLLDLRTGVLARRDPDTGLRTVRFVSLADPHALGLRAEAAPVALHGLEPLTDPGGGVAFERGEGDGAQVARTLGHQGQGIAVAARDRQQLRSGRRIVERLAAWTAGDAPAWDEARHRLSVLEQLGFDRLLADHREAWARRWCDAGVSIEGAADDELAARFALFQLLAAAPDGGEAPVGARGLTGAAYGGHVFWDADVFVLPALAAMRPAAARAMLEYRIRRLPAARAIAAAHGWAGARFPWESASDGSDVTPPYVHGRHGERIPVHTGRHEVHIVADVAWAAVEYASWSGDRSFLAGPGRDLLVETARYWASRARRDAGGSVHLEGVMGPDEYHHVVDDNAFTNVMARWNLRRAADLVDAYGGDPAEASVWRDLAEAMVDGYDPGLGLYEQFAGYWDLEPLLVADVARPPVAADLVLGAGRVAGSQLIKQADVLMLHHLVPGETVDGSLLANLAYYEPRTAHGSSLSPAVHAALWPGAGQPDRGLELFRIAARLDLDDLTGTTAGGLHLATIGGVWQALAYGFLGLRPHDDRLELSPRLPTAWDGLGLRLRFRGQSLGIHAGHDQVAISCERPLLVAVDGGDPRRCDPPGQSFRVEGNVR